MIYTQAEKEKMDTVLKAFQSHIDRQEDYEILYSQKAGYLRVMVGESCDNIFFPVTGFAHLIQMFTDDFIFHEKECFLCQYEKEDYDNVRSKMTPILDTLGEYREEAYAVMDAALENTYEDYREDPESIEQVIAYYREHFPEILEKREKNASEKTTR